MNFFPLGNLPLQLCPGLNEHVHTIALANLSILLTSVVVNSIVASETLESRGVTSEFVVNGASMLG